MAVMIALRQPSRRRDLGRLGLIGSLLIYPLSGLQLHPIEWSTPVLQAAEPIVGRSPLGFDRLGPWQFFGLLLAFALCVGLLIGIIGQLLGTLAARRLRADVSAPSDRSRSTYRAILRRADLQRGRPELLISERLESPLLIGFLRPSILIPVDWDLGDSTTNGSANRLSVGLAHELAHAKHADLRFQWLTRLAASVWFPVLPVWWIAHQLRTDQEYLADEAAAQMLGGPLGYTTTLVSAASVQETSEGTSDNYGGSQQHRGSISSEKPIVVGGSSLLDRVSMLLRSPFSVQLHSPWWWRLSIAPTALLLLIGMTRFTISPDRDQVKGVNDHRICDDQFTEFRLNELSIPGATGTESQVALPVRLPDEFRILFQIKAPLETLSVVKVAGIPIASGLIRTDSAEDQEPLLASNDRWHEVELIVEDRSARVRLDQGREVLHLQDQRLENHRLVISTGSRQVIHFRDLSVRQLEPERPESPEPLLTVISQASP